VISGGIKALTDFVAGGGEKADSLFRAMVEALSVAIYTTDAEGRLTFFNAAAAKLSGRTPELGTDQWCVTWKIFLADGEPLPHDQCPMAIALKGGEVPNGIECIAERPDGTRFWFTPCPAVLRDVQGRIVGGINLLLDITDRKSAEIEAERTALLLSAIVDSSDDAIISKDLTGTITSWNQSAERVFGYTAAETVGLPVSILIPADRLDEERGILERLRRGERVDHYETLRRRKDGTIIDISLTISPVKDKRGNIIGASKIARDITERKQAEARLLASEERFRQLADAMPHIVWTARPDGTLDYYNERWYEFSGFSRGTFGDASWEPILHSDDIQRCREIWYGAIQSGQPYKSELRFWDRSEQRWRWFLGQALPIRDADGTIVKWFGSSADIDDQKRVEDDLRRANQDLEQFAFSASHDLQEPMRTVKIYSELLAKSCAGRIDGEALEFLSYLRSGATRMEMLVRDLLTYTQVARFEKPTEAADAGESLASALAGLAGIVAESGARITADPLPSLRVHDTHLQQLFQNLIGNAIKYRSPEQPPVVHITAERQSEHYIFSVSDNGIGIDPEYKEKVFGLFKRLHTSDEYSGTGIGLAICQRIVDLYRGRIWVESEPGKGSTFRFTFPL
jgi:PAS domain S-box-containing protein